MAENSCPDQDIIPRELGHAPARAQEIGGDRMVVLAQTQGVREQKKALQP